MDSEDEIPPLLNSEDSSPARCDSLHVRADPSMVIQADELADTTMADGMERRYHLELKTRSQDPGSKADKTADKIHNPELTPRSQHPKYKAPTFCGMAWQNPIHEDTARTQGTARIQGTAEKNQASSSHEAKPNQDSDMNE